MGGLNSEKSLVQSTVKNPPIDISYEGHFSKNGVNLLCQLKSIGEYLRRSIAPSKVIGAENEVFVGVDSTAGTYKLLPPSSTVILLHIYL